MDGLQRTELPDCQLDRTMMTRVYHLYWVPYTTAYAVTKEAPVTIYYLLEKCSCHVRGRVNITMWCNR